MVSRQKNRIQGDALDTAVGDAVNQALATPDADRTLSKLMYIHNSIYMYIYI